MNKTKQRGSAWSIKLAVWFYKLFGYMPFFILLYPITFVYYIKATNVRKALKLYYKQIDTPFSEWKYFEHLRRFAIVMTDRFISKIDSSSYKLIIDDKKMAIDEIKNGAVILFSHFGGWSVMLELLKDINIKINVVMQEAIKKEIKDVEDSLINASNDKYKNEYVNIIDLSKNSLLDVSMSIANALSNKEIIAMMGDRVNNPKRVVEVPFFGENIKFNKTPFELAQKSKLPLVVYFVFYKKPRVYELKHFTIKPTKDIYDLVRQYAIIYENAVKSAPNQWFNLYDFWLKNPQNVV